MEKQAEQIAPNTYERRPRIYVTLTVDNIEQYQAFINVVKGFIDIEKLKESDIRRMEFDGN